MEHCNFTLCSNHTFFKFRARQKLVCSGLHPVTEIQTLLFQFGSLPAEYSYVWPMASAVVRSLVRSVLSNAEVQKHLRCVPKCSESYKKQATD